MFAFARLLLRFAFLFYGIYLLLFILFFYFTNVAVFTKIYDIQPSISLPNLNFFCLFVRLDKYTHTTQEEEADKHWFVVGVAVFGIPCDKNFELRKFLHSKCDGIKCENKREKLENKRCATRKLHGKTTTVCINVFIWARWVDPLLNKRKSYIFFWCFFFLSPYFSRIHEKWGPIRIHVFCESTKWKRARNELKQSLTGC